MGAKGKGKWSLSAFSHETSEYHLEDWANNNISNPLCTSISVYRTWDKLSLLNFITRIWAKLGL